MDELTKVSQSPYNIILPRVMILSKESMEAYSRKEFITLRNYVDSQEVRISFSFSNPLMSIL